MVAEEFFVNCYSFNPFSQVKNRAICKVSYKTILSRGRSRSRNSDLRLRGAEKNNFGTTTMPFPISRSVYVSFLLFPFSRHSLFAVYSLKLK